jgi:multidrug efflux pump subunit AcrB
MNSLIEFFVRRKLFGNILTLTIFLIGAASTMLIRREVFPNVSFDIIVVRTIFPGASPEETEKLVTNPLEQDLKEVDGIKKVLSLSTESQSEITLFLDPDQTTEERAKNDIQDVVDQFTLPQGAEKPKVTAIDSKLTPIVEVTLSGDLPELELRRRARLVEDELESLSGVARVVPSGMRDLEIRVEADPHKLAQYRISLDEVVRALQTKNVSIPAGSIEPRSGSSPISIRDREKIVRTIGEFKTPEEVAQTVVRANELGVPIRVKDLGKVTNALATAKVITRALGSPGISLTVLKKEKGDAIQVVRLVKSRMAQLTETIGPSVKVSYINDLSQYVERRINILSGNLLLGLVLVFVLLAVFLRFEVAVIVSLGIPFAFLGAMAVFYNLGNSLNLISLIGFIIVSGMLVDDAIVVTDNSVRMMEEGLQPEEAAIEGAKQVWPAVTASVLTTVAAFAPMLFMSGIFGKFVREIPIGVILALLISLVEAFLILPGHIADYVKVRATERSRKTSSGLRRQAERLSAAWESLVLPAYARVLSWVLDHKYKTALATLALFIVSLLLAGKVMKFQLFPPDGVEIFFVRIDAPTGASLKQTEDLVVPIEKVVASLPKQELDSYLTKIGIQQQDPNDPSTAIGTEYAQIAVFLTPETSRARKAQEIMDDLRKQIGLPEGLRKVAFVRAQSGPPVGRAVSLSVRAKQYDVILPAVEELKRLLATIPGVMDIEDSYTLGKEEIVVQVNEAEAAAAGLGVAQVGQTVRAAFDGIVATTIPGLDEEIDVRVSLSEEARKSEETLLQLLIPNPRGNLVPLSQVAGTRKKQGISRYEHEANERQIRVTADVNPLESSSIAANGRLKELLPEFSSRFPGVSVQFGGEDEDTQESFQSLGRAFGVAFLGIFLILVFTFGKLLQPLLVLLTIPLGMISVILTFLIHGRPLSFFAMLGVIALAGVIVNNAIVMIDFVNQLRDQGVERRESIMRAAQMRIRPIFLTTATTVAGLLPTAYGIGGLDQFVVPIALALGWGLAFGALLTAVVFPAAISMLDDIEVRFESWKSRLR